MDENLKEEGLTKDQHEDDEAGIDGDQSQQVDEAEDPALDEAEDVENDEGRSLSVEREAEDDNRNRTSNQPEQDLSEEELDAIADIAIEVIRELLVHFDAEKAEIEEYEGDEMELIFDIIGSNLAVLIGRHGRTLEAMQYLVSAIVSKRSGTHYPVVVDIEGYVNRRKQKLVSIAKSSAARAIRQRKSVKLRPMSPYERRIIHMALRNESRVRTESEGTDPNRQVVIYLK